MKRPVMQTLETEDGMKGVPYPHDDEWTIRQLQVRFSHAQSRSLAVNAQRP